MRLVRVGPLPEGALEAAAEFYGRVLAQIPPRNGEGDHAEHGGGARGNDPDLANSGSPRVPLHHPAGGPPPHAGEDIAIVFLPAPHDHRAWRLAVVQDFARSSAPARVNGIVGDDEAAITKALAYLEAAPGVTGQLLAVDPG